MSSRSCSPSSAYPAFRVLFPNQVIPADDLARATVDVATGKHGRPEARFSRTVTYEEWPGRFIPRAILRTVGSFKAARKYSWLREERKLVQRGANRVLELGDGNVEKFRADFRRKAHQNSKNKAVPRKRLQHKEATQFRGKQLECIGSIRRFRSSPNNRPDGFNQKVATAAERPSVDSSS